MERRTPLKRLGEPEDIALCALYLASPAGSFVTGKLFEIDGGLEEAKLEMVLPDLVCPPNDHQQLVAKVGTGAEIPTNCWGFSAVEEVGDLVGEGESVLA